jgi:cobaltochelatase CobS
MECVVEDLFGFEIPYCGAVDIEATACWNTPKKIDGYVFRPSPVGSTLSFLTRDEEFMYVAGPSGCGKTTLIEQTAAKLNRGVIRVNHDGEVCRADIVGQYVVEPDKKSGMPTMKFVPGPLVTAMLYGSIYLADEFDMISSSVAEIYKPVLEGKSLNLLECGGKMIEPARGFKFCATGNTRGSGDSTGLYAGAKRQNEALMQRFTIFEELDYPSEEVETKILQNILGDNEEDVIRPMLRVANDTRGAYNQEEVQVVFSTRTVINIAKQYKYFGDAKRAYEIGLINRLSGKDKAFVIEKIQTVFGV